MSFEGEFLIGSKKQFDLLQKHWNSDEKDEMRDRKMCCMTK